MACQEESEKLCINVKPADTIRGPPDAYKNQSEPRGALFISNCRQFDVNVGYEERHGSDSDVDNIERLFTQMGYDYVHKVEDLAREELLKELDSFKDHKIHREVDSLVVVFMSHGEEDILVTHDGKFIKVEEICNKFDNISCPMLQDKPKVFFFQHCRGKSETAIFDFDIATEGGPVPSEPSNYPKPGLSHAFLCFSTRKGFVAYRDLRRGSVFIENVCKVFMERAKDKRLSDLIGDINLNMSKSNFQQSCEMKFINHHYPFYFNPSQPISFQSGVCLQMDASPKPLEGASLQGGFWFGVKCALPQSLSYSMKETTLSQPHGESPPVSALPLPSSQDSTHGAFKRKNEPLFYVFILSYLLGSDEDIKNLEFKFNQMQFKVLILPPVQTLDMLKESIRSCGIKYDSNVIVFFFGEGFENYLYLGKDSMESVSFKAFIEAFMENRMRERPTIVFTNTCFNYKTSTIFLHKSLKPLWNSFHMCVKVNGNCCKGSLFTTALLQELKRDQSNEEFVDFASRVKKRVEDLSANDVDQYIVDIHYYGVYIPFQFPHYSV